MKPFVVFHIACLALAIIVGWSAGAAHDDLLLKASIVLSLIFFAGACISWDIEQQPDGERVDQ